MWKSSKGLILILGLSVFLRVFLLDFESLWLDEGSSIKFAKLSPTEIIKSNQDAHPPLYYLILHFWMKIFGDSEFSVRFPSVIFGVITVYVVYKFCLEFWGGKVALFSSLLVGISTFQVFYSQEARMYSLLCLLSTLSFLYFAKILKEQKLKFYVFYLLINVLLLYTHLYSFFILFAQVVYIILIERKRFKEFSIAILLAFLFYVPRLFHLLKRMGNLLISGEFWLPKPDLMDILKTLAQFAGATYPMPRDESGAIILKKFVVEYSTAGILLLIMIGLFLISIFKFKNFSSERRKFYIVFLLWFISPIFVPYVLSQFATPFYFARYAIASSVAFYILVSIGFENLEAKFGKYLLDSVVFLSIVNLALYYVKINKEQWRDAVKFVEERANGYDLIIASKYVFYYYSKREDIEKFNFPDVEEPERSKIIGRLRSSVIPKYKRVWFVSSHTPELEKLILESFSDSMEVTLKKKFLGIDIFLFERRGN